MKNTSKQMPELHLHNIELVDGFYDYETIGGFRWAQPEFSIRQKKYGGKRVVSIQCLYMCKKGKLEVYNSNSKLLYFQYLNAGDLYIEFYVHDEEILNIKVNPYYMPFEDSRHLAIGVRSIISIKDDIEIKPSNLIKYKSCVLHIGAEKTGSTSIQSFLELNRERLKNRGILYPQISKRHGSQFEYVIFSSPYENTSDLGYALDAQLRDCSWLEYRKHFIELIDKELTEQNADKLIISSEHFHSRLRSVLQIRRVKELLENYVESFKVILYIRRQDRMFVSRLSTKCKITGNYEFDMPDIRCPPNYYNFYMVYKLWSEVFGSDSLVIRVFDKESLIDGDVIADFCTIAAIDSEMLVMPEKKNPSLSCKGLQFLSRIYEYIDSKILNESDRRLLKQKSIRLAELLYKGKYSFLTKAEAEEFYSRFEESNNLLFEAIHPSVRQTHFSEDFSDYPDNITDCGLDDSDLMEIIYRILSDSDFLSGHES